MKSIIVTGAAGNLGRAVVKQLTGEGHRIHAVLGLGENSAVFQQENQEAHIDMEFVNLVDETVSEGYVKNLVLKNPDIEAAVLLVGGWQAGSIAETTGYELDKMFKLNFATAYNVVRPLMEHFYRKDKGHFIFVSARPGINPAEAKSQIAYSFSKSLLLRLAEVINDEGKSNNVRASVVIPSQLDTPQNRKAMPHSNPHDWVKTETVADTIAFLLNDSNKGLRETVLKVYNRV